MSTRRPVPCLVGPTASGKSAVALALARATHGEVIACDAFSVYRGLEVLSAAPQVPPDVPHHLVGLRSPSAPWSASDFAAACDRLVEEIRARGRTPWIVGGTALYLRGWLKGFGAPVARDAAFRRRLRRVAERRGTAGLHAALAARDPVRAREVHPNDLRRVVRALEIIRATGRPASAQRREWEGPDRVPTLLFGLRRASADLDERIRRRTEEMFEAGVLAEAERLRAAGPSPEAAQVLGYDVLLRVLDGGMALEAAQEEIARRTRRFARKQTTFFGSFEGLRWIDVAPHEAPETVAARILARGAGQLRGTSA